jgi:hypothetical protein
VAEITLAPTVIELGLNPDEYESIVGDLREAGHDARLQELRVERRSSDAVVVGAAFALWIFVGQPLAQRVRDKVLDEIIAIVERRLRRSRGYRGRQSGVIYGPNDEVLRRFELPEGDSDADSDEREDDARE